MADLHTALSEAELDSLADFLLDRIDDDADTEGLDEGILVVPELDGFLTTIISGPEAVMPSRWLPAVWGDFEPAWESTEEVEEILSLMMRLMNEISVVLMNSPENFEPVFFEREVEGKTCMVVDEWCEGYLRGVDLTAGQWAEGGEAVDQLLEPIKAFTERAGWPAHDLPSQGERQKLQQMIAPNVRALHAWWLARRQPPSMPVHRDGPRVGRNDPCPCGSGRKYKKCCLQ